MRWGTKVVLAMVVALCVIPTDAFAAAPANDNFANREVLSGSLPIEVTRSNVEATKEEGESISPFGAGHSVWFEWEAPATEWVTIGVCDDQFPSIVGIFTGAELANLTPVANGNQDEGPDCLYTQRKYTFKAVAGTRYVIAADGNGFFVPPPPPEPPPPPPVTEGEVVLRIEPTPLPPNDAFANAEQVDGGISEEPGGSRFYFAHFQGYNWKATSEPGEFTFGSSPVDSVWYRWTPPESGTYRLGGPCCGSGFNFALFRDGFGEGDEMLVSSSSAEVSLIAGNTYWIDVYGIPLSEGAEPTMGSFSFNISANLEPRSVQAPPATALDRRPGSSPLDTAAPETTIDKTSLRAATRTAKFWFSASEPAQGFLCRLDKGGFKPCGSPRTYKRLKPGRHAFRVEAVDLAGNVDSSAAVASFRVPRPQKRR